MGATVSLPNFARKTGRKEVARAERRCLKGDLNPSKQKPNQGGHHETE
jgi:hypothetical protein